MLTPVNRHLVVDPILEQRSESGVLVPSDYRANVSSHMLATLIRAPENSIFKNGIKILVPSHLVEEIVISGKKYFIVLENHVVGYIND